MLWGKKMTLFDIIPTTIPTFDNIAFRRTIPTTIQTFDKGDPTTAGQI